MLHNEPYFLDAERRVEGFNDKFPCVLDARSAKTSYLLVPFFYLFGSSLFVFRLFSHLWTLGAIIATFYFTKYLFGISTAYLATLLLAVDPSLFIFTRLSGNYTTILIFFAMLSLVSFAKWQKGKKNIYFYLGCFSLGFGADIYLVFWGFIFSLGLAFIILRPRVKLGFKQISGGALSFFAGMPFFTYYFIPVKFSSIGSYTMPYYSNIFVKHVQRKNILIQSKNSLMNMYHCFINSFLQLNPLGREGMQSQVSIFTRNIFLFCIGITLLYFIYLLIFKRKFYRPLIKRIGFVFIILLGILILSFLYFFTQMYPHQINVIPFWQIIVGFFFVRAASFTKNKVLKPIIVFCLSAAFIFILGFQAYSLNNAIRDWKLVTTMSHGHGHHFSNTIYKLTDYLLEEKIKQPFVIGWGVANQVQFYSQDKIRPVQVRVAGFTLEQDIIARYKDILQETQKKYIFTDKQAIQENVRFDLFEQAARGLGLALKLEQTFYAPDNKTPVYYIYSASK